MARIVDNREIRKQFVRTEPSLSEKWELYKSNPEPGENIDFYNSLLEDISSELPFRSEREANEWYDLGNRDYDKWIEVTDAMIRRKKGK